MVKKKELLDFSDDTKAIKPIFIEGKCKQYMLNNMPEKIFKNTKPYIDHIITSHFYEVKLIAELVEKI